MPCSPLGSVGGRGPGDCCGLWEQLRGVLFVPRSRCRFVRNLFMNSILPMSNVRCPGMVFLVDAQAIWVFFGRASGGVGACRSYFDGVHARVHAGTNEGDRSSLADGAPARSSRPGVQRLSSPIGSVWRIVCSAQTGCASVSLRATVLPSEAAGWRRRDDLNSLMSNGTSSNYCSQSNPRRTLERSSRHAQRHALDLALRLATARYARTLRQLEECLLTIQAVGRWWHNRQSPHSFARPCWPRRADRLGHVVRRWQQHPCVSRCHRGAGNIEKNRLNDPLDHELGRSRGGFGTKLYVVCCGHVPVSDLPPQIWSIPKLVVSAGSRRIRAWHGNSVRLKRSWTICVKRRCRFKGVRSRSPRIIISDHGAQFRNSFGRACEQRGIKHVRGKVGVWQLNAKIERFFRTLKAWQRRAWIAPNPRSVQRRLDAFCAWYNEYRLHSAHGLTPNEAAMQIERRTEPMTIRQKGDVEPTIRVTRQSVRGDPRLFYLDIDVRLKQKFAA